MKRYAIIVATEEYTYVRPNTLFCHKDAQLLKKTLHEFCDFAEQDVVLELLSPDTPTTPVSLLDKISSVAQRTQSGDTMLFYYAGHGTLENGEPYIILPDTNVSNFEQTALALRDVSNILRMPQRVNVRIFDACHSGFDVRDQSVSPPDAQGFVRSLITDRAQGWLTFAACREDEFSHGDPNLNHGVFTYFLCEAIRSFPEDSDILPEILKIRVCEQLADWCQRTTHVQTPTMNAAISGNLVIARRKRSTLSESQITNNSVDDGSLKESRTPNVAERLARVRSLIKVGTDEHLARLTKYMEHIRDALQARVHEVESFGCEVELMPIQSVDQLPESFKEPIARFIEKEQLQPLHNIRVTEKRSGGYNPLLAVLDFANRPTVSYEYIVEQGYSWPNSYIELRIQSDGYLPSALLYYYLIPLQVKAYLDHGVATTSNPLSRQFKLHSQRGYYGFLDLNDDRALSLIDRHVENGIHELNEQYPKLVQERLSYLERELNK